MNTLVFADVVGGKLSPATLSAITAASKIGAPVTALVAGKGVGEAAKELAACTGVTAVQTCEADYYENGFENLAALLAQVRKAGDFKHVVGVHSTIGKQVLPRAAASEDFSAVADVVEIDGGSFKRPAYAGNVVTTVKTSDPVVYMTIRPTAFDKAAKGGSAAVSSVPAGADLGLSKFVSLTAAASDQVDLSAASAVVSGGRGLKNGDNFKMLYDLAKKIPNCAVGATRAAVDAGFVGFDLQIGQTGKIVAPQLYIAVGLSGAIQHLAGMKDSKTIVAINNDPDALIFSVADYGLVDDLFKAVPALTAAI